MISHRNTIQLSVVVVPVGDTIDQHCDTTDLEGCLEALALQIEPPSLEVIVPYHADLRDIDALRPRFPNVTFRLVENLKALKPGGGSREHHDELRAHGARAARGDIIAFLEDHVHPEPSWASRSVETHRQPFAAIGGAVENGIDRPLNWAAYFCDLGRYQNPIPDGESPFVSLVNASYKRSALDPIRSVWGDRFNETTVNAALVERGHKLALSSNIVVHQFRSNLRLATCVREFFVWGRSYARTRNGLSGPRKRALFASLAPLLPLILLARMAIRTYQKKRPARPFVQAFPLLVLLVGSWSWGETVGYWQEIIGHPGDHSARRLGANAYEPDDRSAKSFDWRKVGE